jgi:hypothetical protein
LRDTPARLPKGFREDQIMIVVVTSRFYSLRGFEHYGRITELGSEMNCKFAQRVRILSFQALPSGL